LKNKSEETFAEIGGLSANRSPEEVVEARKDQVVHVANNAFCGGKGVTNGANPLRFYSVGYVESESIQLIGSTESDHR
jgi:hypothetical protein